MTNILPNRDAERIAWSMNFEQEFPAVSGVLGFTNMELTALLQDCAAIRHAIMFGQGGAAFSRAGTAFKNAMLGGVGENTQTPTVPTFTPPPSPPAPVDAGIVERVSRAMNRAKLSSGYTNTIGEALMIATVPTDSTIPPDAKTTVTPTSITGSIVRLDWTKGKFDGVFIDSQRNDETTWTRLDFDMRSPYEDSRVPLNAGKPEERRYRLRYFIDNQPVGAWSDMITVITLP